ncbi:hypothetical protein [Thiosocius teredinicola]|uniref:hypothetical protein n=1 Tax=Thiosocius teredinicola TaxID=1973002 RepID=UPI002FE49D39
MTKSESKGVLFLALIAAPFVAAAKLVESVGWFIPLLVVAALFGGYFWYQSSKKEKRLSALREKYDDEKLVQKIFEGYFWQGQPEGQLVDSLGQPVEVDRKVLKTKTKEIWKYNHMGGNRFGLRVTVENGYVVGWDKKA